MSLSDAPGAELTFAAAAVGRAVALRRLARLQRCLRRRVGQAPRLGNGKRGEFVHRRVSVRSNVPNLPSAHHQRVGDQATVTAPPQPLGAHDGGCSLLGQRLQRLEPGRELTAGHVVGVAAKALHSPTTVWAVRRCAPSSAQLRKVKVEKAVCCQLGGEDLAVEPRQAARVWVPTHIGHLINLVDEEEPDELRELMRRMPDSEECPRQRPPAASRPPAPRSGEGAGPRGRSPGVGSARCPRRAA